jgi:hypothetical protein
LASPRPPSRPRPSTPCGTRCASATAGYWSSTTPNTQRTCVRGGRQALGGCWSPPATRSGPALPPPCPSTCSPTPRRSRSSTIASAMTTPPWTNSPTPSATCRWPGAGRRLRGGNRHQSQWIPGPARHPRA